MRKYKPKLRAETFSISTGLLIAVACAAAGTSTNNSQSSSNSSSSGGSGATSSTGSQSGFVVTDASTNDGSANSSDGQVVACANGEDCVCPTTNVAVIGTPGKWGLSTGADSDTAFQDWLNSSSAGTARVDNYRTKPTLTADFLAGYNVVILAGLGDDSNVGPWWTFSSAEISAFQDWIMNKGGGVITLSGYSGDGSEVTAKNALLAFSGISYNQDAVFPACALVDSNNSQMCWCSDGSLGTITEWNRKDPVVENLSLGVTMIGMANGRSIVAPADAHVAATASNGSYNLLVGEIVGRGRVLAYSDEWITYTNQWSGAGLANATNPTCQGYLPQDRFQTAQFWYNMIRWTQPKATCFKIVDSHQTVTVW